MADEKRDLIGIYEMQHYLGFDGVYVQVTEDRSAETPLTDGCARLDGRLTTPPPTSLP